MLQRIQPIWLASWVYSIGVTIAVAITYFLAARLSLALLTEPDGVAVFWPAAGVASGILIAFGRVARWPVAVGVMAASITANLLGDRNLASTIVFTLCNAGDTLLIAWLIESYFGSDFSLNSPRCVLGLFLASAIGASISGIGGTAGFILFHGSEAPILTTWLSWFASDAIGNITVAPLMIGLTRTLHDAPELSELKEGSLALVVLTLVSAIGFGAPTGYWFTILPLTLLLPLLLWPAAHCRPVFAAAASFIIALAIVCTITFGIGRLGDPSIRLADRVHAAQVGLLAISACALVLAALFAERRQNESTLKLGNVRLQLALSGAKLGAFSVDLGTGLLGCDDRAAHIHGYNLPPRTIQEGRRFVHPDDLIEVDALFAKVKHTGGVWNAEYRVMHPPGHPNAGETRWVAIEGSVVCNAQGNPERSLGVTRDITDRKEAALALVERNTQLALAGKAALVGSFAFDVRSGRMQVSSGYVAIHGLPDGTEETTRSDWRARVHPDDLPRLEADFQKAIISRHREHHCDYRIVLSHGEVKWIEARSLISYDGDGAALRVVGANIDVTERKKADQALAERSMQLALAGKAALVGSFAYDCETERMQISAGYAAIHAFPEGTTEIARSEWLARLHPEDRARLEEARARALRNRAQEFGIDYRVLRPEGEVRWIDARIFVLYGADGCPQRIVGVDIDITERKRAEWALAERTAQLEIANNTAQVGSYTYNYVTSTLWLGPGSASIYGLHENSEEMTADEWRRCVHPGDLAQLVSESRQAIANRQRELVCVFRILRDGLVRWIETRNRFFYNKAGRATHAIGASIDVTERRRAEDHNSLLVAELDHRVKNALACVAAIAEHAREDGNTMDEFLDGFKGRIQSLANAHALLSSTNWQGVSLAAIVRSELAPWMNDDNTNIQGPDIDLVAEATQPIAMVLHELATNAGKYGSLSNTHGRVSVRWKWQLNGSSSGGLVLEWRESGGPPVIAPHTLGYGSTVIRDLIPYELNGGVDYVLAPDGVSCKLDIPANWVSQRTQLPIDPPHCPREFVAY